MVYSRVSFCIRKDLQEFLQKIPIQGVQIVAQMRLFCFALCCNVTYSVPGSVPKQKQLISI